jgi:hypothetical protein
MTFTAADFQSELDKIIQDAQTKKAPFVIVISGDLHRLVGVTMVPKRIECQYIAK